MVISLRATATRARTLGFPAATSLSRNCSLRVVACRDHGSNEQGTAHALYPCGDGHLAIGGLRMSDAGLEVELAIAQDLCRMRLRRCWGVWSGVAVSVSSGSSRCLQKRWHRERIFRQLRVGTIARGLGACPRLGKSGAERQVVRRTADRNISFICSDSQHQKNRPLWADSHSQPKYSIIDV